GDELAGVLRRPLFAAMVDLGDKLRRDETSRRQLETFLQYVLALMSDKGQDLQGTLASITDVLQVLVDDGDLSPVVDTASLGMSPAAAPGGPGAADVTIKLLKALTDDTYDPYHVVDRVLPNLVNPIDGGQGLSPLEIFMDVIADVNRIDASSQDALAPDD